MNRYLFPIKNLKLDRYLKWWLLYNDNKKQGVLSDILEGFSFTLNDSIARKFKKFDIEGHSEQESTTGKNLINVPAFTKTGGTSTYDGRSFTFNLPAGTYTLQRKYTKSSNAPSSAGMVQLKRNNVHYKNLNAGESSTLVELTEDTELTLSFYLSTSIVSSETSSIDFYDIQLETGSTATSYEPYTGGQASPNPSYPQEIKSCGDNGSINERIVNKNLVKNQFEQYLAINGSGQNRTVVVASYKKGQIVKVKPNTIYSVNGNYTSLGDNALRIGMFDEYPTIGSITTKFSTTNNSLITFTTDINTKYLLLYNNLSVDTVLDNFILVEGNYTTETMPAYVPHEEQTYTIPTQEPMRSIGNVRDGFAKVDGVWNEVHNIGQGIFDGSSIYSAFMNQSRLHIPTIGLFGKKLISGTSIKVISNRYLTQNINYYTGTNECFVADDGEKMTLYNSSLTTTALWNEWFANNPTEFTGILAEPTYLPCTEEQIAILENLPSTYKEQTNIISLDEVEAYLKIQYYKKG